MIVERTYHVIKKYPERKSHNKKKKRVKQSKKFDNLVEKHLKGDANV